MKKSSLKRSHFSSLVVPGSCQWNHRLAGGRRFGPQHGDFGSGRSVCATIVFAAEAMLLSWDGVLRGEFSGGDSTILPKV